MKLTDRILLAWKITERIDALEGVVKKVEALDSVIDRLARFERSMPYAGVLEQLAGRLERFEEIVKKIESPEPLKPVSDGKVQEVQQWNRLKLLSKFVDLSDKAEEIEKEWQRIQQDEHDFKFVFETSPQEDTQAKYLYKKGIADGVKWCLKRFC